MEEICIRPSDADVDPWLSGGGQKRQRCGSSRWIIASSGSPGCGRRNTSGVKGGILRQLGGR